MRFIFVLFTLLFCVSGFSQNRRSIEENEPITIDGIELGYIITEEDNRTAGKEEFSRYKVSFYANNGGCARAYRLRESNLTESPSNLVATFIVRNANGKRMTAREGKVNAREWWVPVRVREKNSEGKEETKVREMMAGYIFRVGDHIETSIIVLVPLGEKPKVDVILGRASDL